MPDPDHEGQPEVLSAAGRGRQAHQPVSRRQQHQPVRRERRGRWQRARGAPAPAGRQVLLRPGSQEDAGIAPAATGQGGVSQQAGHARRAQRARARHRPRDRRAAGRRHAGGAGRAGRAPGQGRPGERHGGRVPRAAGRDGPLLRPARRPAARGGRRHRGPLQAPLCRRRIAARRGGHGGGAGRQAGDPGRTVRHRRPAHRRPRSVCPAPACAGGDSDADRTDAAA